MKNAFKGYLAEIYAIGRAIAIAGFVSFPMTVWSQVEALPLEFTIKGPDSINYDEKLNFSLIVYNPNDDNLEVTDSDHSIIFQLYSKEEPLNTNNIYMLFNQNDGGRWIPENGIDTIGIVMNNIYGIKAIDSIKIYGMHFYRTELIDTIKSSPVAIHYNRYECHDKLIEFRENNTSIETKSHLEGLLELILAYPDCNTIRSELNMALHYLPFHYPPIDMQIAVNSLEVDRELGILEMEDRINIITKLAETMAESNLENAKSLVKKAYPQGYEEIIGRLE